MEKWFKEHGFSEKDIELYYKFPGKNSVIPDKTFMKCFNDAKEELVRLGFTKEEAKKILILNRCNVTLKEKYEERLVVLKTLFTNNRSHNVNIASRYLKHNIETINSKIKLLKLNKFSEEEIKKILNNNDRFFTHTLEDIQKHINTFKKYDVPNNKIKNLFINESCNVFKLNEQYQNEVIDLLISIGFSEDETHKIIKEFPKIFIIEKSVIKKVLELFENYITSKEETISFFVNNPNTFDYNENNYNQMKDELNLIGLNDIEVKIITLKAREIVTYRYNKVKIIKNCLEDLGFEINDIKTIINLHPKILYHDSNKIKDVYKILKDNYLTHEIITDIFLNYPKIVESNCKSLDDKIKLLHRLGILDITLNHPKNLIQGCEKTYLRYLYIFNVLEEEITDENINLIYASSHSKMPSMDVLKTYYSYNDDMENTFEKRIEKKQQQNIKIKCYGGY